jgi:uncharacterized protein YwqG
MEGISLALPPELARVQSLIESTAEPCLVLRGAAGGGAAGNGCMLGGTPRMAAPWPRSPERPMAFVGQLDFAELRQAAAGALAWLPPGGRLLFFYDEDEQRWGFSPDDQQWWRLVFDLDAPGSSPEAPEGVVPHPGRPTTPVPAISIVAPGDDRAPALRSAEWEAYSEFHRRYRERIHGDEWLRHQVGGHADWIQGDARLEAVLVAHGIACAGPEAYATAEARRLGPEAGEWRLLWQVSSDEELGFTWGDVGHLYVLIRDADVQRRDFQKARVILQCT